MTNYRNPVRSTLRQLGVLAALVAVMVGFVMAPAAHAGPGEGDFYNRANSARASYRVHRLISKADLVTVARRHAARMASQNRIYHNPALGREVRNWQMVGENVGRGGTVAAIHNAFMRSSSHRANILDRGYTEVGMGTARDARGVLYVVQVFRRPQR